MTVRPRQSPGGGNAAGDVAGEPDSRLPVVSTEGSNQETPDFRQLSVVQPTVEAPDGTQSSVRLVQASFVSADVARFWLNSWNELRNEVSQENGVIHHVVVGSSVAVSSGLSVGYVLWMIRGGVLLSSVLSSMPAWRFVDPLPVLGFVGDEDEEDDESLESLVAGSNESSVENDEITTDS